MLQESAESKEAGPNSDPGAGSSAQRGRKRSHPSDVMDETTAPPNMQLPSAVSTNAVTLQTKPSPTIKMYLASYSKCFSCTCSYTGSEKEVSLATG